MQDKRGPAHTTFTQGNRGSARECTHNPALVLEKANRYTLGPSIHADTEMNYTRFHPTNAAQNMKMKKKTQLLFFLDIFLWILPSLIWVFLQENKKSAQKLQHTCENFIVLLERFKKTSRREDKPGSVCLELLIRGKRGEPVNLHITQYSFYGRYPDNLARYASKGLPMINGVTPLTYLKGYE